LPKNPGDILLIKFWGIGNILMLMPAARALKEKYPSSSIDLLTLEINKDAAGSTADIFENIYAVDIKNFGKLIATLFRNISTLRKKRYDIIIDFEQFSRSSAILCSIIGAKHIMGFSTLGQHREFLYDRSIVYNNNIHITKSFYELAISAGARRKDDISAVPVSCSRDSADKTKDLLDSWGFSQKDIIIIMHAGTSKNFILRRWPAEYFADLADKLADSFKAKLIFTGLEHETALINRILRFMKNKKNAVSACGMLDFFQLASLIKSSDLVISADTAPVHIASCLDIPVAGLYGPNAPLLYGPWGKYNILFYKRLCCSPCITNYNSKSSRCLHSEGKGACMKKISADEVFSGIKNSYFSEDARFRLKKLNQK
jgi:ADP-heptose:LPS heptosyltransferase